MSASSPSPNSSSLATPPPSSSVNASPPESPTPPSPLPPPPPPDTSPPPSASPPISASPPPVSSPPPPAPATSPPPPADAPPPSTPASPPLVSPTVPATPPTSPPPTTPSPPPPASAPPPETPNPPSAPPPSSPPPVPPSSSPPPPQSAPPPSSQTSPPSPNEPAPSPPTTDPPSSHSPPPGQQPSSGPPPQSISPPPPTQLSPPVSHPSPPPPHGTPSSGTPPSGNSTDCSGPSSGNSAFPVGPVAGVTAGVVLLGLIGIIIWCMVKRKKRGSQRKSDYIQAYSHGSSPQPDISLIIKTEPSPPFASSGSDSSAFKESSHGLLGNSRTGFTYQELFEATNGFAPDNFLGEGGFGSVYKGVLPNGREVAVKQLKIGGAQGEREFKAEVDIISRIHHRHLVSLVGYCIFESRRLLVYDYMPNQTLHYHLHEENRPVLDWATRIKIALGAARGIAYLHEDCHPRIIHRDIKSSNILLDAKFEARVSDFGLAKLALDVDTHVSTRVMGTFGYMAPEYATSGKLTEKSDVYSYGVVLLELITGRRPVDESQPVGDESLVLWARPLLGPALETGRAEGLVDPRLEKNYVENELLLMIEAAAACVRHSASKRPRMRQVVRAFDGLSPADLSNGMRVGESEIYDPAQQSAQMRWLRGMAFGNEDFSTGFFSDGSRSSGSSNPNPGGACGDPGPEYSTQQSRNHPSQQPPTQNIYFSSQRAQNPTFSGLSTTPDSSGQSSQNPNSSGHSSRNMDASSRESRNMESRNRDSSSRESQSS